MKYDTLCCTKRLCFKASQLQLWKCNLKSKDMDFKTDYVACWLYDCT